MQASRQGGMMARRLGDVEMLRHGETRENQHTYNTHNRESTDNTDGEETRRQGDKERQQQH